MLPTTECAAGMDKAAMRVLDKATLSRMAPTVRQCLAAILVHECTSRHMRAQESGRREGYYDSEEFRRRKAAAATADAFKEVSCEGVTVDEDLEKSIIRAWQTALLRGDE